jgi:hypothetical protein
VNKKRTKNSESKNICDTHLKRNIFNKNRLKHEKTENKFFVQVYSVLPYSSIHGVLDMSAGSNKSINITYSTVIFTTGNLFFILIKFVFYYGKNILL